MSTVDPLQDVLEDVRDEVKRQDAGHPSGYPATRDGVFLGIMTAVHELEYEAIGWWRLNRCKCPAPGCTHASWEQTRAELVQAAAVIMRTIRAIDTSNNSWQAGD